MVQLINENVKVILSNKRDETGNYPIIDDIEGASNVLGVHPDVAILDQALQGDSADNYPGGIKIGKVSAAKLATKFKTIDGIYNNLDDPMFYTKKGTRNALYNNITRDLTEDEIEKWGLKELGITTNRGCIEISFELAKLDTELELGLELKDYQKEINKEELLNFLDEMEFDGLVEKFE